MSDVPETPAEPVTDTASEPAVDAAPQSSSANVLEHAAPQAGEVADDAAAVFGTQTTETAETPEPATADATPDTGDESGEPDGNEGPETEATSAADGPAETSAEVLDEDDIFDEPSAPPVESPFDRPGKWFVVHTQSGYEKKVKQNLEARISSMNMEDRIYEVVIPMEDVVEFRQGKKVVVPKKMFPGYLLVRCELNDDAWYVVRNTPGVTGFVGQGNKPSPLPRRDVESFLAVKPEGEEAPAKRGKPRLEYEMGETVRVREGPFADFSGEVIEINEDQLKVKVLVNIFGRETPVELEFAQVAKL